MVPIHSFLLLEPDAIMKPGGNTGVLIAYDCSGSTGSDPYYYGLVKQLVEDNLKAEVVAWDSSLEVVPRESFKKNSFPKGRGGTSPSVIIPHLHQIDFVGHLILLTDGQVGNDEVDRTDELIQSFGLHFERVTAHFVKIGGGQFNVAVSAPFSRNCPHEVFHHVQGQVNAPAAVSAEDLASLQLIDTVNTPEEFDNLFVALEKAVIARTLRRAQDTELHDKITLMSKRVQANLSKSVTEESKEDSVTLLQALEEGNQPSAVEAARQLTVKYYFKNEDPHSFPDRISRLLGYTGGSLRNIQNHTDIASNRARTALQIPDAQLPEETTTTADFECPITLDVDVPALLIKRGDAVLAQLNEVPKLLERVINNPLSGIRKLVPSIIERLDHPIGSTTWASGKVEESPLTRAPILDALIFGASAACCKYNDRTMAKVLSEAGLKLGNMDLWFALFLEAIERTPYLAELVEPAREHMKWRLQHRKSWASLTGLAQYVSTQLPLGVCCWFCVCSSLARPSDLPISTDTTRVHADYAEALIKLCELVNYQVPEAAIRHIRRLAALFSLLAVCKRDGRHDLSGNTVFQLAVQALHSNALEVHPCVFLPLDGPPKREVSTAAFEFLCSQTGTSLRQITWEELVYLAGKVHPNKSAVDIDLPVTLTIPPLPPPKEAWTHTRGCKVVPIPICPLTCRPFYNVKCIVDGQETTEVWTEAANRIFGGAPYFSVMKMYATLVEKLKRYPTPEELMLAEYRYYVEEKKLQALPEMCLDLVTGACRDFESIAKTMEVETFVKRYEAAVARTNRMAIETGATPVAV